MSGISMLRHAFLRDLVEVILTLEVFAVHMSDLF